MVCHFAMLDNIQVRLRWQLSKRRTKPRTLRHGVPDQILQAPEASDRLTA